VPLLNAHGVRYCVAPRPVVGELPVPGVHPFDLRIGVWGWGGESPVYRAYSLIWHATWARLSFDGVLLAKSEGAP
jgi:hypothetical protein